MDSRHWIATAGLVLLLGSCGAGTDDVVSSGDSGAAEETGYCADLISAAQMLDGGGAEADYNDLLLRVAAQSPPDHADTWVLMSRLSEEPFSYENFNTAIDSLDRISDDLNSTCPGLDRMFVDDDGRMRMSPSG